MVIPGLSQVFLLLKILTEGKAMNAPLDNSLIGGRPQTLTQSAGLVRAAMSSPDPQVISTALNSLIAAYDAYAAPMVPENDLYGFNNLAAQPEAQAFDQSRTKSLADTLIDFQVASILMQGAQIAEPSGGGEQKDALLQSVQEIQTNSALTSASGNFGFAEFLAAESFGTPASPDLPSAVDCYTQQVRSNYDELIQQSLQIFTQVLGTVGKLDSQQIQDGLKAATTNLPISALSKIEARALEIFQKGVQSLTQMVGDEGMKGILKRVTNLIDQVRSGGEPTEKALKYLYSYDKGLKMIAGWLKETPKTPADLDAGVIELAWLNQRMVKTFTVDAKITSALQSLSKPLKWVLQKAGVPLPVDLFLAGAYLILLDVTILQGMDYADTTNIVTVVEGIQRISRRVLVAN
jgi:hypothetical protein